MKHINSQRFNDVLFEDINPQVNYAHNFNRGKIFSGNIRLNIGLYRTTAETEHYISESLKKEFP